jgi:hypothetical protein
MSRLATTCYIGDRCEAMARGVGSDKKTGQPPRSGHVQLGEKFSARLRRTLPFVEGPWVQAVEHERDAGAYIGFMEGEKDRAETGKNGKGTTLVLPLSQSKAWRFSA